MNSFEIFNWLAVVTEVNGSNSTRGNDLAFILIEYIICRDAGTVYVGGTNQSK